MKRKLFTVATALMFCWTSIAQTTDLGGPISWKGKLKAHTVIPLEVMPGFDLSTIQAEDAIDDQTKAAPWRFGYKYDTDLTLTNSGAWTTLPNGNRLWRTEIVSDGAMTMNLLFENLYIPEGGRIYLFDKDETNRIGAYTSRNNREDGQLGTELVIGSHIVVEYYEPANVQGQGHFKIANVIHGYRSLNIVQDDLLKGLNSSGNCNIDARCPLGNGWDDQIRSVAMIVVNGNGICTGALINNNCNDGTPYFLTANHCLGGGTGNWAFRFNWEVASGDPTLSCASTTQTASSYNNAGSWDQSANGATILVSGTQADHALLQIDNMTVTDAQNWGCFYAGWNNDETESAITQVTGIHHPAGDIKKICQADDAAGGGIIQNNSAGAEVWYIDNWEQGVTEPGSSGSPLFDQNGRIIGQLYGGSAACSGTGTNGGFDYYGRLGVSWGLGIDAYLTASCGTSVTNDGWDPNQPTLPDDASISSIVSPTGIYCTGDFTPEVVLKNIGTNNLTSVTINYDLDGGTNNVYNWTGNLAPNATENIVLAPMTTITGPHVFNSSTSSPNGGTDSNPANDAASSNFTTTVGGQPVNLTLTTDCWGYETYWEVVDVTNTVVASGGNTTGIPPGGAQTASPGDAGAYGDETTINETLCLADGCYDFRIFDDYGDGLDGIASGCGTNGNYIITDSSGTTLVSMVDAAFGNSDTVNFCLSAPCVATFDVTTVEEDCFGDNDGSVTVNFLTGNASGATFDIGSGTQVSNTFGSLPQGGYTITVIDGDACTSYVTATLGGPSSALSATAGTISPETLGNDGSVDITAAGGSGGNTFAWTGPNGYTSTDEDPNNMPGGSYDVTITDANGCTATISGIVVLTLGKTIYFEVWGGPGELIWATFRCF